MDFATNISFESFRGSVRPCCTGSVFQQSQDTTESNFRADMQKQDAVIRRIEIIGEATAHLSSATRQAMQELPFRKMRGMRNIIAHDYANVDPKIVWEVATIHVPEVRAVLEEFFAKHRYSLPPRSA
jgi:uncharacterized protein with HEPN domain